MADFTEKQLEDWLVANWAAECGNALFPYMPTSRRFVELVGRQVHCQYGIIDILAFIGRTFVVVELKATRADEKVVEQVTRYQRAVEEAALTAEFEISAAMQMGYPSGQATLTSSVVIAPDFTAKAAKTLSIIGCPVVVTLDGNRFSFSTPHIQHDMRTSQLHELLRPYVSGAMGWEIGNKTNRAIQAAQSFAVHEN